MDKISFTMTQFPKLRADAYNHGIPGIHSFLTYKGFKTIDFAVVDDDNIFQYTLSEQEYLILVLKYG